MSGRLGRPWLQLAGTLLWPIPMVVPALSCYRHPEATAVYLVGGGRRGIALYAALAFGRFVVRGPPYRRTCEPGPGFWRSVDWGLTHSVYLLALYVVPWRAVGRVVTGRNGWAKTRRNAEAPTGGPVAKET